MYECVDHTWDRNGGSDDQFHDLDSFLQQCWDVFDEHPELEQIGDDYWDGGVMVLKWVG